MITILNISDTKFSYNGIAYFKNFTPFVTGNKVSIVNTYDACISLTNFPTIYSDISVDGVTYGSVAALQNALLPVLYNRTFTQTGSLTVGYIPKATGSNTLGNSIIYENNGKIGIGNSLPLRRLDVGSDGSNWISGVFAGTGSTDKIVIGNLSGATIGSHNSALNAWSNITIAGTDIRFSPYGAEKMRLNDVGRLGVGTDSPSGILSMKDTYYNTFFKDVSSNYGSGLILSADNGSDQRSWKIFSKYSTLGVALTFDVSTSGVGYGSDPSGLTYSEKIRIGYNGNVGIGRQDVDLFKLSVNGTIASMSTLGNGYGSYYIDHPGVQSWKIGVSAVNTSMFSIGNDIGGAFANKILNITNAGNVLIGTTSDTGDRVNVNGSLRATAFNMVGNYNATISTNSGWSSFQTLVPIGTLNAYSTYFISVWHTSSGGGQPYEVACSFMYSAVGTNGGGVDNEFTPIVATHTGGTGAIMTFRSRSGTGSISGLEVKFTNFNVPTGTIFVKATKVQGF